MTRTSIATFARLIPLVFTLCLCAPASAVPTLVFGPDSHTSNTTHTGASGIVDMSFSDVATDIVKATWTITNTTGFGPNDTPAGPGIFGAGATVSSFVAFGTDLPQGVDYVLGSFAEGNYFKEALVNEAISPFGSLDIIAADDDNPGGGQSNGIPEGLTDTVMLNFTGTGLTAATLQAALTTAYADPTSLDAVARFKSVNAGAGSDKLLYKDPGPSGGPGPGGVVPEPSSLAVWGLGIAVAGGVRYRRRKR